MSVAARHDTVKNTNLVVFLKHKEGVPMTEALRQVHDVGTFMPSNKRLSQAFVGSDEWQGIVDAFGCWSGTMTAYERPDQKLGNTIEYMDPDTRTAYVFRVPDEHVGRRNVLLVAEHGDYTLNADGDVWIVEAQKCGVVPNFPGSSGTWHLGDRNHDVPSGKEVDGSDEATRLLWRTGKRVGLLVRGFHIDTEHYARCVYLSYRPSEVFGVVTEASHADSDIISLGRGSGGSGTMNKVDQP